MVVGLYIFTGLMIIVCISAVKIDKDKKIIMIIMLLIIGKIFKWTSIKILSF